MDITGDERMRTGYDEYSFHVVVITDPDAGNESVKQLEVVVRALDKTLSHAIWYSTL